MATTNATTSADTVKRNAYEVITDRIINQLEAGVIPWRKPWNVYGGRPALPMNLLSQKPYRGINQLLTGMSGYSSPFWLTYKQAASIGGHVNAGERSTPICFWKIGKNEETDNVTGETVAKSWAFCRLYHVFNVAQCTLPIDLGSPAPLSPDFKPIDQCEAVIAGWSTRPPIKHGFDRACYLPLLDSIMLPKPEAFNSPEEYYSTAFHELTHSTGHKSRLNREGVAETHFFGDAVYSREELVAEMGAAFLAGHCAIENRTIENSAAYLQSWLKVLRADSKLIISAASAAQRAADLILGSAVANKGAN
jgi:antirestriction protein ArdC